MTTAPGRARDRFARYNAADDLLARHAAAAPGRVAVIDPAGEHTVAALARASARFAGLLRTRGIAAEQRVLLCMADSARLVACLLGALRAGAVPVPVNSWLPAADYDYMLADSRAAALVVDAALAEPLRDLPTGLPDLRAAWVSGAAGPGADALPGFEPLEPALATQPDTFEPVLTRADDPAFWLYTSGTTGAPKGVMHRHGDLAATADTYARHVLAIGPGDVVFSAAKLFFAYGLGNSLTFPLAAGATVVLLPDRATPAGIAALTRRHPPTLFFGVPTLYAMMLNTATLPDLSRTRLCISAGEALPAAVARRWRATTGLDILDGIGSTEMLHIFISNQSGAVREECSGRLVPGYEARIVDDAGRPLPPGTMGALQVAGPSSASGYWSLRERTERTFHGRWVATGDQYVMDADGWFTCCGRTDDMLKVGGIYVAPNEVEGALLEHPAVAEAAVVGATDADGLVKPRAFVVLRDPAAATPALAEALVAHVRTRLADYKRPRRVDFVAELPKTATGKVQRFRLRDDA